MGMTDPIADMLSRIRNANQVRLKSVDVLLSQVNFNIAKVLKKTGYISGFNVKRDSNQKGVLRVYLRFTDAKDGVITGIERISRPGKRVYVKSEKVPRVLNGYGVAILSTSRGIITDREARELNIGGEVLCKVW